MATNNCQPDEFIQALVYLIEGWSNGPEDLGKISRAFKDNDEIMIGQNADVVLKILVQKFAFCSDYKLKEFAHRHELKYTVRQSYASKCGHHPFQTNRYKLTETTLHLNKVRKGEGEVTLERIEDEMRGSAFVKTSEKCPRCGETIIKTQERSIPEACDPDFLTISFSSPQLVRGNAMEVTFSNSMYQITTVLHWDPMRRKAAVSARREDGWKWHGTDVEQAEKFTFPGSLNMTNFKIKDAILLLCVRANEDQCSASSTGEELPEFHLTADNFDSSSESVEGAEDGEENTEIGAGNEVEERQMGDEQCPSGKNREEQEIIQHDLMGEAQVQAEVERLGTIEALVDGMHQTAARTASSLGISLREGIRSMARGQCTFEAVESQILNRRRGEGLPLLYQDMIQELGAEHFNAQTLRERTVDLLEENERALPLFICTGPGGEFVSEEERRQEFMRQLAALRQRDQYAYSAADLLLDGLSLFLGLNILVINTSTPEELPISFHTPGRLGGDAVQARHESPLILIYDRDATHYEEARPLDEASEARLLTVQEHFMEHGVWFISRQQSQPPEARIPLAEMFAAQEQQRPTDQICSAGSRNRMVTSSDDEEIERQRMIPIATSTPVKDSDRGQSELSQNSPRREASMFQDQDEQLQASLSSSVGMESTNYSTQVHSIFFVAPVS